MDNVVKIYQEEDGHGFPSWTASGPACAVSGYSTVEQALTRYYQLAELNHVDTSDLAIEYGYYQSVWTTTTAPPLSNETIVKQELWLKEWEKNNENYTPEMFAEASRYVTSLEWLVHRDEQENLSDLLQEIEVVNGPVTEEEISAVGDIFEPPAGAIEQALAVEKREPIDLPPGPVARLTDVETEKGQKS